MLEENTSFIMYKEWIDYLDTLPDDLFCKLMRDVFEYQKTGKEKQFNKEELTISILYKMFINQFQRDAEKWQETKKKRSEAGKIGGLKSSKTKQSQAMLNNAKQSQANQAVNVNVNDNVNLNVNDNVNCNVNTETDNTTFLYPEEKKETVPDATTEPMKNFGSLVYNEFINAGLPHEKSLIDFLFGGLKTGCEIIHHNEETKRATSQEILQAVKNYIDVLNDPKCFYSVKHSFVSFCKSEQFYKFLPSNFVKDNWYSYDAKKEAAVIKVNNKTDFNFQNIKYIDTECPNCKNKTLYLDDALNSYMCTSCKRIFDNLTTE